MKRLQIYIQEELDQALAAEAARGGTSKAALIREFVADRIGKDAVAEDSLDELVGSSDAEPAGVDDVLYGP